MQFGSPLTRLVDDRGSSRLSAAVVLEGSYEIRWAAMFVEPDEPARIVLTLTDAPEGPCTGCTTPTTATACTLDHVTHKIIVAGVYPERPKQ